MRNYLTAITADKIRRHYQSGGWKTDTLLDHVTRHATERPDRPALIDSQGSLSHLEMLRAVTEIAGLLSQRGVTAGTPVLVQLPNSTTYAVVNVAISALGGVIVPLSNGMASSEVNAVSARVGARLIVCSMRHAHALAESSDRSLEIITEALVRETVAAPPVGTWRVEDSESDPDAVLDLMFTSGTTGQPKGIINTTNTKFAGIRPFVETLGLGPDDAWLVVPPMSHNAGWLYSFLPALLTGGPVVFQEAFDPAVTLRLLRDHDIKCVFLTPTHATDVIDAVRSGEEPPSALRYVLIGGALTTTRTRVGIRESLSTEVLTLYGSTENQAATFIAPGAPRQFTEDSVGAACPGTEVAIFADDRRTVLGVDEVGHVGTRGPGTFMGYFDSQAATDAAFNDDDWFFAGDLGSLDQHSRLHLTGRDKELIIRGGHNIVPEDVELALRQFPGARNVAAVGIPDERLGERVCLVVECDGDIDLDAIAAYLDANGVGKNLWPEAVLRVDEFPLTDLGKVRRSILRSIAVEALVSGSLQVSQGRAPAPTPGQTSE